MSRITNFLSSFLLFFIVLILTLPTQVVSAKASNSFNFILLSQYRTSMNIGEEFYLVFITSTGDLPSWKTSSSKIASVNTYGVITAKSSGTATITAKIKNAEASCKVTVKKTKLSINKPRASIERNEILPLSATTSNNSPVTWKSNKKSIATVDENGNVTGIKPGEAMITATADGTSSICKINVKYPTLKLSNSKITLFRNQTAKISASVSSGAAITWKSTKKSVALIDNTGTITGIKHGTTTIIATVDGVSKTCEVIVKQPTITLSATELRLKKGKTATITAAISSGNSPIWSSSNVNIATVSSLGKVTAVKKGKAYIYASEDGIKVRCTIIVKK